MSVSDLDPEKPVRDAYEHIRTLVGEAIEDYPRQARKLALDDLAVLRHELEAMGQIRQILAGRP